MLCYHNVFVKSSIFCILCLIFLPFYAFTRIFPYGFHILLKITKRILNGFFRAVRTPVPHTAEKFIGDIYFYPFFQKIRTFSADACLSVKITMQLSAFFFHKRRISATAPFVYIIYNVSVIANQPTGWCGNPPVIRFNRGILTSGSALLRMTDDFGMAISPIHIKYRFPLDNGAGLCYSFLRILTESERLHER